ncbi:hypothetical protein HanRHA438_Chr11g0512851 [Helianthus annuus]|uniref:Uncharacterized protein n=1 Tax=Helianthus annuus TaxID=4232 RepID=A0A9K3N0Q5_HELAN|nr:hypothetical protein HanXRQr2_Chr11g0500121 [Helianthus annuus]KAJ0502236.1 hypothetical protein HanHA300_Chr11g0410511 [Helianthus annuus]KAJ0510232.1 hypothetical protein HanIR_Chr11g0538401 [Helianthus annuus]KAJ0518159.1 hypothetical protein HanHA89_Chr11g0434191 [Helianthus annuus]KAJ0686188.1 hypothetical protein HanLR1_Chr11g0411821 [Helianthus annuus]
MERVKTKGKAGEGSSSQPEAEAQQKKRRLIWEGDPDSEEDAPPTCPKPDWTSGSILDQPVEWQTDLFHEQMNKLQQRKEAFICEKEIREVDFGPFGMTDKFKALGWEAALKCYDGEVKNMYDREIQEWMATLTCPPFNTPSKMKLIGTVNGVTVEMSYDSLRRIAKFDIKPFNQYIFPRLEDLYFNPQNHPNGKMCSTTSLFQVNHCVVEVIWAIGAEDKGSYKRFKPFDIKHLGPRWEYKESERYHKLKSDGRRWRALKADARPLRAGEADEPETSDEEVSSDDDYREDTFTVDVEMGGAGPSGGVHGVGTQSGYIGSAFDYAQQPYDPYWAHTGNMEQVIEQRRPPTFADCSEPNQMLFDQQTYIGASMERALKQSYDR